ncbi:IclR family transcriptional regulator [Paludibacterium paludis]|uniref:Transcriptional regulator n=1 Tax=Paludibacterium paludis TaxID=1225769 RepID=A0A918U7V1_9NEIS|nr:IclR family transcriptional regulator [Paludibacterium paludis]GGY08634.1 transcriptional regulator [Paludibacterium paludis]
MTHERFDDDRLFVTALARGLALLSAYRPGDGVLGNQELAARTGLPKSTVSRLSYTLAAQGYLVADPAGGYRPGPTLLALAATALAGHDVRRAAAPLMQAFSLEHAVSTSLAVRDGTDVVYLETCRSQARVSVQLNVGSRVPLATTAIGRALYAGLPDNERARLDDALAARYGDRWETVRAGLAAALRDWEKTGYTASFGDYETEVMAVGVTVPPLWPGQQAMSLNASGPVFLFDEARMRNEIAPALVALGRSLLPGHGQEIRPSGYSEPTAR